MSQQRKNFIYRNETFTCQNCLIENPLPKQGIRNHCYSCCYSMHLDKDVPGDRLSTCQGLMIPQEAYQNSSKGWMIVHCCQKCGHRSVNKISDDDNWDQIIKLTNRY